MKPLSLFSRPSGAIPGKPRPGFFVFIALCLWMGTDATAAERRPGDPGNAAGAEAGIRGARVEISAQGARETGNAASTLEVPETRPGGAAPMRLTLRLNDEVAIPEGMAILTKPSQVLRMSIEADAADANARVLPSIANAPGGRGPGEARLEAVERASWKWTAGVALDLQRETLLWRTPATGGHYEVSCRLLHRNAIAGAPDASPRQSTLRWGEASFPVIVGEAFDPSELLLNGVPIGVYPDQNAEDAPPIVFQHKEQYRPPKFLFKVTKESADLPLSQNFKIGDFAMDFEKFGERQYIAIDPELISRLELILRELRRKRSDANLVVLRGYLSPIAADALRKKGAQISEFSRFLYGDAAIIIVDADGDNRMDDLTGDGVVDIEDARFLAEICATVEEMTSPGGIGTYGRAPDDTLPDTPFVQVDIRGRFARWELAD